MVLVLVIMVVLLIVCFLLVLCFGLNYIEYIKEGGYDIFDYLVMFIWMFNLIMVVGVLMVWFVCFEMFDYEVEMMIIIGKGGWYIFEEIVLEYVFGYIVFNDGFVWEY